MMHMLIGEILEQIGLNYFVFTDNCALRCLSLCFLIDLYFDSSVVFHVL